MSPKPRSPDPWRHQAALDGIEAARGMIRGLLAGRGPLKGFPREVIDALTKIERAKGALIQSTMTHDEGAVARCSYCGRYTASFFALTDNARLREMARCDCGELHGWSGSFEAPGPDAQWSIGLEREP